MQVKLGGALDCLAHLHSNGCEWDDSTVEKAATNRDLECLKYAVENGCPWGPQACVMAYEMERMECLQYSHDGEQNLQIDRFIC